MYGTVARLQAKPGTRAEIEASIEEAKTRAVPGMVADYIYRLDTAPDEYYLVAVFTDKAAYVANANSPEQDAQYRRLRALLVADPEWHDGEVVSVSANVTEPTV
jgi:quinol monooxygenase YgiN